MNPFLSLANCEYGLKTPRELRSLLSAGERRRDRDPVLNRTERTTSVSEDMKKELRGGVYKPHDDKHQAETPEHGDHRSQS